MAYLSVVIPTYNEGDSIIPFVKNLQKSLQGLDSKSEIIIIDDDSPDGTAEKLKNAFNKDSSVRVFVRTHDRGLGLSIKLGVEKASGDIIIGMDADFNHDAKNIPSLVTALVDHDLVVASRFKRGGGMAERWRFVPTFIFNAIFRILGMPIWDNTSGFYAIRRRDLVNLGLEKIYYGYGDYHLRLVWYAKKAGLRLVEIPTYYQKRQAGVSKSRLLHMIVSYTKEILRLRWGKG